MPPNTPATHQANLLYHANVRHPPYFVPQGRVGFNVWTPSNPGLNHAWHINNLHNGNGIGGRPTLLEAAMRNPYRRNLLPYQNNMLANAVSPVQDTYAMMRAGIDGRVFQQYPPHLAMWQRYHRTAPHFRYLAVSSQPSIAEQLGMMRRPAPGQGPGQFPFAAEGGIDGSFDNSLNGLPRSTLQRVGDAIGGLFGRRTEEQLPVPGFPAGFPRSVPTVRSFPGAPDRGPFNGVPESRDRGEARLMLTALRQEIQKFVRANSPMLPATERALGMLVASIDASMNSPTLTRNHAMSSQMFFQSIVEMDIKARGDRNGGTAATDTPAAEPAAAPAGPETTSDEEVSTYIRHMQRALDSEFAGRPLPPGATPVSVFFAGGKIMIEGDRELVETFVSGRRGRVEISSSVERFTNENGRETLRSVMMDPQNSVDRNRLRTLNAIFRIAGALESTR